MRRTYSPLLVAVAVALSLPGCDRGASPEPEPTAKEATKSPATTPPATKLADLSTSLEAVRDAFNAHKDEARFLTLLSPT